MNTNGDHRKLVVIQLSGGNDYLNCVVPYTNSFYRDNRPRIGLPEDQMLRLDDQHGLNPGMGPIKDLYKQGKVAIIHGVGYPNPSRSHFRSMDIWHTCEPDKIGDEGWLGRAIRELDPAGKNVVTGVNFGAVLPRAFACRGVPVASVNNLESYGLLTSIPGQDQRAQALNAFSRLYTPKIGHGWVTDYLGKVGLDAMAGAEALRSAPAKYSSSIEYAYTPISQTLKGISQVLLAGLGTRILYAEQGGYDTHANGVPTQAKLWTDLSRGVHDFYQDLQEHNASEDVVTLIFSEFGRRVYDNGTGTDHGKAGVAFLIGDSVNAGMHGEYPSLRPEHLDDGDMQFNLDFRGVYSDLLENWLGLDPNPIVGGLFEQPSAINV